MLAIVRRQFRASVPELPGRWQCIISSSLLCLTAGGAGGHEFTKLEWWCSWLMGWLSWASSWPPGPVWEGVATGAVREYGRGSPWSGVPRGLCFISKPPGKKKEKRWAAVANFCRKIGELVNTGIARELKAERCYAYFDAHMYVQLLVSDIGSRA